MVSFTILDITSLFTFALSLGLVSAGPPRTSETASGPSAINTGIVSNYEEAFSSWQKQKKSRLVLVPAWDGPCVPCVDCDFWCALPPHRTTKITAAWRGKATSTATSSTSTLAFPGLPRTATESPFRDVVVRASPAAESEKSFEDANTKAKASPNLPPLGKETTDTFYTLPLSGFDPAVLPLIFFPPPANRPLTLLAYANTTFFSSFISASLVSDLNLTSSIHPLPHPYKPLFTPENNLKTLFGFDTKPLGVLTVDILAGKDDRQVEWTNFTVFETPDHITTHGLFRPDLLVGIDFLNMVEALQLGGEYSGSREAGSRDGLGVLVQKVYETKTGKAVKDEL